MVRFLLTVFVSAFVVAMISGCAVRHQKVESRASYDIKSVDVNASKDVPRAMADAIKSGVSNAAATSRGTTSARAVALEINLSNYTNKVGESGFEASALVSVVVHDATNWEPVYLTSFKQSGFGVEPGKARSALAAAINAKLRYMFALSAPPATADTVFPGVEPSRKRGIFPKASARTKSDAFLNSNRKFDEKGRIFAPKPAVVTVSSAPSSVGSDMTLRQ